MKKLSTVRENKGPVEINYAPRHYAQAVTIGSMDDGIFNNQLRYRSMICVFPPQCEGPMSYQTMAEDQVVHTGQDSSDSSESERDSENGNGSEQLKVSI